MVAQATQMAILPGDPQFATKAANFPAADLVPVSYVPPPGVPAAVRGFLPTPTCSD